jgi:hypothetical protein
MPFLDSKSTAWDFFTDDLLFGTESAQEPDHDGYQGDAGPQSWRIRVQTSNEDPDAKANDKRRRGNKRSIAPRLCKPLAWPLIALARQSA